MRTPAIVVSTCRLFICFPFVFCCLWTRQAIPNLSEYTLAISVPTAKRPGNNMFSSLPPFNLLSDDQNLTALCFFIEVSSLLHIYNSVLIRCRLTSFQQRPMSLRWLGSTPSCNSSCSMRGQAKPPWACWSSR